VAGAVIDYVISGTKAKSAHASSRLPSSESDELVGLSSYLFISPHFYTTPLFIFI